MLAVENRFKDNRSHQEKEEKVIKVSNKWTLWTLSRRTRMKMEAQTFQISTQTENT